MIVLVAVLTVPIAVNAQTVRWEYNEKGYLVLVTGPTSDPVFYVDEATLEYAVAHQLVDFEFTSYGDPETIFYVAHKPPGEEGDFGLFPFLGKSFYRFVLKPAYIATKASGKTGGKAVKFFFVQIGHFLF
jgi:hypothetical protein